MCGVRLGLALALTAAAATAAEAQLVEVRGPKGVLGINVNLARPVGEFQEFVDWGGGLALYGLVNLDRGRHFGLRLDGSFLIYGHETFSTPLSPTVRRVWVDVTTDNMIFDLGIGPQISVGSGPVQPYLYGTVGFSYFATVSSVKGTADYDDFASSTNFDDWAPALTAGGGLLFWVSRRVAIDMSAESTYHGEVDYLTEGDVVDNFDGSLTLFPVRSDANLVNFRFGVAIGI